ncbi:hypothetical protein [Candidatus Nitrosotenuis aquarius]|jgi:hypothetical protein|uniref:hypothetical protein n=1 Tax=Candidatus Nitrosotenuis aquarius TaxID=1846278 RepID=UPI0013C309F0|nr:hypothetical protein [Candidatus Nitrosotenuis aquarius]
MFQKSNYYKLSVVGGIIIIASLIMFQNFNSCPARQFSIIDEIIQYESAMDYSMCVSLAEKIQTLNAECPSNLETLQCG